jgi:hypothetical protein
MRFILPAVIILLPCFAFAGDAPPATAPSETRYAGRDLQITSNLGMETQQKLITAAASEVAKQLGLSPEQLKDSFRTHWTMFSQPDGTRWTFTFSLPPAAKPVAKEFLDQLVTRFRESMAQAARDSKTRDLEQIKPDLEAAEKRLAQAADKARRLREELRQVADRADVSAAGIQSAVASLEEERQRLELDVLGKNARREALEEQIAVQSERAAKKVEEDPVMAELRKVVELREDQLKRLEEQHTAGMAPRADLDEAMARLAELRAKLLERRQQATIEAGGEVLATFNRELLTLSVDLREMNARLEFVNKRLDRLRQATELLDPLEGVEREESNARALAEGARMRGREIEDRQPPKIEILSSENRPEPPKQPPQAPEIMY